MAAAMLGISAQQMRVAQAGHESWLDDDQLHVILVGTGCPMYDVSRSGPCTAVIAGEHFLLVDSGPGTSDAVQYARLPRGRLSGVLYTHHHSDHIGDLGEMMAIFLAVRFGGPPPRAREPLTGNAR